MTPLSFEKFVSATEVVASDLQGDDYMPTFVYPGAEEILCLEGVPADAPMREVARSWAAEFEKEEYFVGYQDGDEIVAEHFMKTKITDTARIAIVG